MDEQKTAVEIGYDDKVWQIDESPEMVVAKVESAKQQGKRFVELSEDRSTGSRIWLSVDEITAIYDWREEEDGDSDKDR